MRARTPMLLSLIVVSFFAFTAQAHAGIVTMYTQPDDSGEMLSQQPTFITASVSANLGNLIFGKESLSITFVMKDPNAGNVSFTPKGIALGTCPTCQNLQKYLFTNADRALLSDGVFHTFTVQTGTTTLGVADGTIPIYISFFGLSQYQYGTRLKSNASSTIPYLIIQGTSPPPPIIPQAPPGSITVYTQSDSTAMMTNPQQTFQNAYIDSASLGNLNLGQNKVYITFTMKDPNTSGGRSTPIGICVKPAGIPDCNFATRMQTYYFTNADRELLSDQAFHTFMVETGTTTSTYADGTRPVAIGFFGLSQYQYGTKIKSNASSTIPAILVQTPAPPDPCANGGCVSNVLFLPGLEASRLYVRNADGSEKKVWEPGGDSDARVLAMDQDGTATRNDIYTRDVIDNAYLLPVKGNVYKSFLEQLAGMKSDKVIADYGIAPYDWRLSLDDILNNGAQLQGGRLYYTGPLAATTSPYVIQELRRLAKGSRTGKVTIVAHSNGGLVAKALTNKLGAEAAQLIDKIVFVAVPQTGTPKAVGAILHGFEQALPIKPLSFFGMSDTSARELARNMPSVYNLLPSANYFTYTDNPVITISGDPLLAPWRVAYGDTIHSGERLRAFLTDPSRVALPVTNALTSPIIGNRALLTKSEAVHNTLDFWTPPAGIALTEIAGWGEETLATIAYYQGLASTCTARNANSTCAALATTPVLQYRPETVLDGDGTVVVPSALWTSGVGKYWMNLRNYNKWWLNGNIPRKHADVLESLELRTFIQNIITNKPLNNLTSYQYISTSTPLNSDPETRLHFTLHSPLSLDLYDDLGNHTGISTSTNSLEENVPGSRYLSFSEVQYISVPSSANLRLVMSGYAEGSFTLDMTEVQGVNTLASTTFAAVPSLAGTIAAISIPAGGGIAAASSLAVDQNGDGTTDLSLAPKLGGVVIPRMPLTVTAENKAIILGSSILPLTASISDSLGNAVTNDLTGAADCTTTATLTSPVGVYPITCSVGTLSSEKYEFTTFVPGALRVQYRWGGFSEPIQNKSIFKAGSTVPVKFQLKKADGTIVQAAVAPQWADGSVYKWDSTNQQYIYNWSTKGLAVGQYHISAKLDDGTTRSVTISLK